SLVPEHPMTRFRPIHLVRRRFRIVYRSQTNCLRTGRSFAKPCLASKTARRLCPICSDGLVECQLNECFRSSKKRLASTPSDIGSSQLSDTTSSTYCGDVRAAGRMSQWVLPTTSRFLTKSIGGGGPVRGCCSLHSTTTG